jgi:gas vesicle protein
VFHHREERIKIAMRWNTILRSLLKTAVYIMDQTAEQVDRVSDRAADLADQAKNAVYEAKEAIYPQEDHTLRNVLSFAVGVGVGVGAAILLTPSSGEEIRNSISERVHDISDRVTGRVSSRKYATGTE